MEGKKKGNEIEKRKNFFEKFMGARVSTTGRRAENKLSTNILLVDRGLDTQRINQWEGSTGTGSRDEMNCERPDPGELQPSSVIV